MCAPDKLYTILPTCTLPIGWVGNASKNGLGGEHLSGKYYRKPTDIKRTKHKERTECQA